MKVTPERFKDWEYAKALKFAEHTMATKGAINPPLFIGFAEDDTYALQGKFRTDEEKYKFLDMVTICFAVKKVKFYLVIHESWMVVKEIDAGKSMDDFLNIKPSKHPNRIECVNVLLRSRSDTKFAMYNTIRDADGKFLRLEYNKVCQLDPNKGIVGDFTSLLITSPSVKAPKHVTDIMDTFLLFFRTDIDLNLETT